MLAVLLAAGALRGEKPPTPFQPLPIPGEDFLLRPESERPLENLVIGLLPQRSEMLAIPGLGPEKSPDQPRAVRLRRELNAINVEVNHGRLLAVLPSHTRVFVAVPDPLRIPEATGHEEEDFRFYLARRVGWSDSEIARRVRFFRVPYSVLFPRDLSEILGSDARRRLVLGLGRDADPIYSRAVERLVSVFPNSFRLVRLRGLGVRDVNTEGGDLGLVWTPEGRVGLFIGRHRVLRYLEHRYGEDLTEKPVPRAKIEEARAAFQSAFFGVEVLIVGEEALEKPELGSEELFHADMVVSVMRGRSGAVAFVPTFSEPPIDAITHVPLEAGLRARVQTEYDLVAAQMARRGYAVARLPFADHPVRSPANVTPYVDPSTGESWVLLGRYPDHLAERPGGPIPLFPLQEALDNLAERFLQWQKSRRETEGRAADVAFERVWGEWDRALSSPNRVFEAQKRIFENNGIHVRAVPLIPFGAGGIHCLLLR